jgi:Spore germination B3/ GerAC like, C-terminal.
MKKAVILIFILLVTGCDYKELSDLSIGTVLGIDKQDGKYVVTALVVSENEGETHLFEGKGISVVTAINNLNLNLTENLYLNHLQSLVISTEVASEGMKNTLNYFLKKDDIDKNFYIFLAQNNTSNEILKHLLEKSNGNYNTITNIFKTHDEIKFTDNSDTFSTFLDIMLREGIEPTLNSLSIKDNTLTISDVGVFKNDKLVNYIGDNISYATLIGTAKQITLSIPCSDSTTIVTIENIKINHKIKNNTVNNNITGNIRIKENNCQFETKTEENKQKLKKTITNKLLKMLDKTINQTRELNSDIFGYGELFYKNYKNPNINYPNLKITNKINFKFKNIESSDTYHE